jgi:hypothetical protein
MSGSSPRALLVVVLAAVVALVGLVDAVVGRTWDLVAVFALTLALQLVLLLHLQTGRAPLSVRRDLAAWVAERAVATGEPPEAVIDQCLASARAGLVDEDRR